ncbi:MAG TPA: hypothetical protein VID70_02920 [Solirubrobacteraceae bacterium]
MTVLITCGLTLVAVLGELAALALAGWEIIGGGTGGTVLVLAVIVVMILAIYYVAVVAYANVITDWGALATRVDAERIRPVQVSALAVEALAGGVAAAPAVFIPPTVSAQPITWRLP